jgi:ABC-type polysaccharide/polyol phosphate export permease
VGANSDPGGRFRPHPAGPPATGTGRGWGTTLRATWAYRDLVRHLVLRDLRLKYKGSALGFAWSVANPLLMATVYTIAFEHIVRVQIERFPLFLLSGLLPWTFFAGALAGATASIVDSGTLVRKVAFPRPVLPIAAVVSQFVQFAIMYALIVPAYALVEGVGGPALLALVPIALLHLLFTAGLGLALSALYVHARDTRHLLDVALQLLFWLTPVVYPLTSVPAALAAWLAWNPLAWFISAYHAAVVDARWPDPATGAALLALALAAWGLGLFVFVRAQRRFAELV